MMAFEFYETSPKTGANVLMAFQKLAFHVTEICDPKLVSVDFQCRCNDSCLLYNITG